MSDPTALVAERVLMIAETSFLDQAATNDLKSAAALIAQQAASIAARDDELIGERWHADEAARQRDVAKATIEAVTKERDEALRLYLEGVMAKRAFEAEARATAAEAERDRLREDRDSWRRVAERLETEKQAARAALSTAKERGE